MYLLAYRCAKLTSGTCKILTVSPKPFNNTFSLLNGERSLKYGRDGGREGEREGGRGRRRGRGKEGGGGGGGRRGKGDGGGGMGKEGESESKEKYREIHRVRGTEGSEVGEGKRVLRDRVE